MIRCPQCHNAEDFAISAVSSITAYVTQHLTDSAFSDAGELEVTDERDGDLEWDGTSLCRCLICQHTAPLNDFEVPEEETA